MKDLDVALILGILLGGMGGILFTAVWFAICDEAKNKII